MLAIWRISAAISGRFLEGTVSDARAIAPSSTRRRSRPQPRLTPRTTLELYGEVGRGDLDWSDVRPVSSPHPRSNTRLCELSSRGDEEETGQVQVSLQATILLKI